VNEKETKTRTWVVPVEPSLDEAIVALARAENVPKSQFLRQWVREKLGWPPEEPHSRSPRGHRAVYAAAEAAAESAKDV
jgi:transposase-like protein